MNSGRIEQVGPVAEVYNRPASAFTAGFIGSNNRLAATVAGTDSAGTGVVAKAGARLAFAARTPSRTGETVDVVIRANRIGLAAPDGPHAYPAEVVTCSFSPTAWRVMVDVGGLTLRADVSEAAFAAQPQPPRPGDEIWISVSPENVWVFSTQQHAREVQEIPEHETPEHAGKR